ncbi:MAG: formate dehydrogenase accessory sulfurtransferase FdhD [Coriobacteriia bacterium]|nr:formate dehydrogenase accessory sulfurtransferase FdhD [Coriobacteriia bacterium]
MSESTGDRLPLTAAVLAGGRSMRMGVDKTLLPLDGVPLLRRVVDAVGEACERVVVVTNRPEAVEGVELPAGIEVLADDIPFQGPLGGLATALAHAGDGGWVLAVAADMPWVAPGIVRALWEAREGVQVVVPVTDKGPEPLLALYHASVLPAAERALATGRRRLVSVFSEVAVAEVPAEALRGADPALRSLVNVNTPSDLADVREAEEAVAAQAVHAVVEVGTRRPRGLPAERPVTIHLNDAEIATVQASPDDLEELAVGFLVAEGILADRAAFRSVDVDHKRGMVYVVSDEQVPEDLARRTRYVTSGCGGGLTFASIGHARGLERVSSGTTVDASELYGMMGEMARAATSYRDTGGMHACGLGRDGSLAIVREDVGRHNALDKLLGRAWMDGVPTADAVLLTTGRVSYEMAVKAAKARVPVVVSRSAVTDLAAELAEELGITLVGYARGGKMNVYTHAERVRAGSEEGT